MTEDRKFAQGYIGCSWELIYMTINVYYPCIMSNDTKQKRVTPMIPGITLQIHNYGVRPQTKIHWLEYSNRASNEKVTENKKLHRNLY